MKETFSIGMGVVVFSIFAGLSFLAQLEWICEKNGWPSISYRIEHWSKRNPWFGAAAHVVVFVLLSHFVNNQLFPPKLN